MKTFVAKNQPDKITAFIAPYSRIRFVRPLCVGDGHVRRHHREAGSSSRRVVERCSRRTGRSLMKEAVHFGGDPEVMLLKLNGERVAVSLYSFDWGVQNCASTDLRADQARTAAEWLNAAADELDARS